MAISLPNIVIKPDLLTLFHGDRPCVLPCPKTQVHQSTYVDSWVHRVPEDEHQPLGRGISLWSSACPILWSNPILLRYITKIAPSVLFCPKTREHQRTCVVSWVHRVAENGHWDAAIHYGVQLAQYCDQALSWYAISRRLSPLLSLALRLRNTKVPVWTQESIWYPKMDISHWDAAIHYGVQLAQYCHQTRSCNALFTEIAHCVLPCPKTQEHQSTCVR